MSEITLSSAVRNNLLSLQNTSSLLEDTQNILATGQRVNSALDDPAAFFTASSLNSRAGDLNRLLDDVGLAIQTVQAADDGIGAISDLVVAAQASARNAQGASGPAETDVAATVTSGETFTADAPAVAEGTTDVSATDLGASLAGITDGDQFSVNGTTITIDDGEGGADIAAEISLIAGVSAELNGDGELVITADDADTDITIADVTGNPTSATSSLNIASASSTNLLSGGQGLSQGDTLTFQIGDNAETTITFGTDDSDGEISTIAELTSAIEALAGASEDTTVSETGVISLTSANTSDSITIGGDPDALTAFGLTAGDTDPTAGTPTPNATRTAAEEEFNNLLDQIDQLAADASFNGNNLLAGDNLTVIFNEDGSSSLAVSGVSFDAEGLGISELETGAFQDDTTINETLDTLDDAITSLRTQGATFGSNLSVVEIRQDFTKNLINTLETGAAGLTLADSNEEAANLLALQTRQSLSSSSLSLASQADQNVLQLLR